jgi:hypothetical protein
MSCIAFLEMGRRLLRYAKCSPCKEAACLTLPRNGWNVAMLYYCAPLGTHTRSSILLFRIPVMWYRLSEIHKKTGMSWCVLMIQVKRFTE